MNDSWSWAYGFKCYEMLRVVDDMSTPGSELRVVVEKKESQSWAHGSRCYEQLEVVDDMSYSRFWAYDFGCYEELRVLEDMNESGSCELKPLYVKKNLRL